VSHDVGNDARAWNPHHQCTAVDTRAWNPRHQCTAQTAQNRPIHTRKGDAGFNWPTSPARKGDAGFTANRRTQPVTPPQGPTQTCMKPTTPMHSGQHSHLKPTTPVHGSNRPKQAHSHPQKRRRFHEPSQPAPQRRCRFHCQPQNATGDTTTRPSTPITATYPQARCWTPVIHRGTIPAFHLTPAERSSINQAHIRSYTWWCPIVTWTHHIRQIVASRCWHSWNESAAASPQKERRRSEDHARHLPASGNPRCRLINRTPTNYFHRAFSRPEHPLSHACPEWTKCCFSP